MFAASLCSRFMHSPCHVNYVAAKMVLRYIQGTTSYGLKNCINAMVELLGFCDIDWGGFVNDMKSTSSYAFSLAFGVFSWCSRKHKSVAQSSLKLNIFQQQWLHLKLNV